MSHNKNFPILKVSRTAMVELINNTKGRFFTSTHIGKDNVPHTINGIRLNQNSPLGYIHVYSCKNKEMRSINPQTVTDLSFCGVHYKIK